MTDRIDFLGAPGVGKSTIYRSLLKETKNGYISERKALLLAAVLHAEDYPKLNSLLLRNGLALAGVQNIILNSLQSKLKKQHLRESVDKHREFFEVVDTIYCKSNNPKGYAKLQGYLGFLNKMMVLEFIRDFSIEQKTVWMDESLSQKVYGLYGIRSMDKGDLKYIYKYFNSMPIPTRLIYIYADLESILSNIKKREFTQGYCIPGHEGIAINELREKTERAMAIAVIGYETLKKRGVPVLKLDSTNGVEANVNRIKQFLKDN